jgi:hypothetical protein
VNFPESPEIELSTKKMHMTSINFAESQEIELSATTTVHGKLDVL